MLDNYYDIEPQEFLIKDKQESEDGDFLYTLVPTRRMACCPMCGSFSVIKHGLASRDVRDTSIHGHRVGLHIEASRYMCKHCKGTFTDEFKSISQDAKITSRLRDYIREES